MFYNAASAAIASPRKIVRITINSGHRMAAVRIENTCGKVIWKNGQPLSQKGEGHGLGLINVRNSIASYDGELSLQQEGELFAAAFFLNMP